MEVLPVKHQHLDYKKQEYYYSPITTYEELSYEHSLIILAKKLEEEIKAAKRTHLSCGEVLLPMGLLEKISQDILNIAESELCGLRGCTLYLLFEGEEDCRRLSTVKIDPSTTSTFELYLTFKQANDGWGFLPQFLKKMTRGSTVVISNEFNLAKKKLYRSLSESE